MDLDKLRDSLEDQWVLARDRGDHRGEIMTLLGMVDVALIETQRDLAERLTSLEQSLPLRAPESWRHEPQPTREHHGPLTRNGQPTARMRRMEASG